MNRIVPEDDCHEGLTAVAGPSVGGPWRRGRRRPIHGVLIDREAHRTGRQHHARRLTPGFRIIAEAGRPGDVYDAWSVPDR